MTVKNLAAPLLSAMKPDGKTVTFPKATPQQVRASLYVRYGRRGVAELPLAEVEPHAAVIAKRKAAG